MKVLLSCYAGMSTSMLIKKMKEHANELECDLEITAVPIGEIHEHLEGVDVILLGPQVRFSKDDVIKMVKGQIPVISIPTQDYGMMRGSKILDEAIKVVEDFKK